MTLLAHELAAKRGLDIPDGILTKEELVEALCRLKLEHLNYVYSAGTAYEKHALKDICLEIPDGEFVGIIGHTGSGKSTLIQHLNGLITGNISGAIYYNGENIYRMGTI